MDRNPVGLRWVRRAGQSTMANSRITTMPQFQLTVSCVVPVMGTITVEADTIEQAIEQLEADAAENGWGCRAWQESTIRVDDIPWSDAREFGIEPTPLSDGTSTDFIELLES